jgi:DNA-binding beta-propeller fold protein YncE
MMKTILFPYLAAFFVIAPGHAAPLTPVAEIPLPDVNGRIDHFGVDLAGQRLFVAALGNDTVEVIDLKANRHLRSLKGFAEPQAVQLVPDANRLYVSNGKADRVDVFDAKSLDRLKSIGGLGDADNIRYDAAAGKVYVAYEDGLRVLDAATGERVGDIAIPGHPESFQLEAKGNRIFANVPKRFHVAVVDRAKGAVIDRWSLPAIAGNYPMALDETGRRLFVGARLPAKLAVYDVDTGKVVAKISIGGDTDDVFFDAARKRIYVICGEGVVEAYQQDNRDRYSKIQTVQTGPGARTGYFVPTDRSLYVAQRASGGAQAKVYRFKVE